MRRLIIIISILLTLFSSCDIFMEEPENNGKLYLIAIGMGYQQNRRINRLDNTYNDFRGIVEQFQTLAELSGRDYEITTFSDYASISGDIVFGFDHKTSDISSGSIFHEYTERMREPIKANVDETSRETARYSIISELRKVFESTSVPTEDDLIFFYFTGHGTEKTGPVIHHSNTAKYIYTDISMKEIEEELLSRYDSRCIMLLDCCYSGRAIDNSDLSGTLGFKERKDKDGNSASVLDEFGFLGTLEDIWNESFSESTPVPKYFYLTACTDKQMSYDYDLYQNGWNSERYGAFTYQILKCWGYDTENMKTAFPVYKEGSRITLGDMYFFIRENMSRENRKRSTPTLTRSRYDITLFDFSL